MADAGFTLSKDASVRFDIDPIPDENQRAFTAIARAALPPTRAHFIIIASVTAISIAATLLTPETTAATTTIGIVAVLSMIALLDADANRRLRLAHRRDPHSTESYSLEVSESGIRMWCAHVDARYPWTDWARMLVTPEFVLFARPSGAGAALPMRVTHPETVAALITQIREWAPDLDITHVKRQTTKSES